MLCAIAQEQSTEREELLPPPDSLALAYSLDFFGEKKTRRILESLGRIECGAALPATISKSDFWELCVEQIGQSDDEGHGALLRPLPKRSWFMVFSSVGYSDRLGEGLLQYTRLLRALDCGLVAKLSYTHDAAHLTVEADAKLPADVRVECYIDLILLVFHCALQWMTGQVFQPLRTRNSELLPCTHGSLLTGIATEGHQFGGNGSTISYALETLNLPLDKHKLTTWGTHIIQMHDSLWSYLAESQAPPRDALLLSIRHLLDAGTVSQKEIAAKLGFSVPTMQRRLAEARLTFRDITRDTRKQKFLTLLGTRDNFDDVADVLGYSDRRSLTRACQAWFGTTPSKLREVRQGGAAIQ